MECRVCTAPTKCNHYQALTCRACSAFFRRTNRRNLQYKCTKSGNCDVTKKNRYTCRYCRIMKCVAVGMVMDLDDNPSTSFDGDDSSRRSPSEASELEIEESVEPEFYSMENIFGDNEKFLAGFRERITLILKKVVIDSPTENLLCRQVSAAYEELREKWPKCRKTSLIRTRAVKFNQMLCDYFKLMEQAAEFCMKIGPFQELPADQKGFVLTHFLKRFPQVFRSFSTVDCLGHEVTDRRIVTQRGEPIDFWSKDLIMADSTDLPPSKVLGAILRTSSKSHEIFLKPYKRLRADEFESSYLIACMMWSIEGVDGVTQETIKISKAVLETLASELQMHYKKTNQVENYSKRIYKLQNLVRSLDRIAEMRLLDRHLFNTFQFFKIQIKIWENTEYK